MPTDTITLQIVKNGGAPANGAITAAFSDSIVLGLGSTASGVRKVKYRIYEFPDGFALPSGWTQEAVNIYSATVQNGGDAPVFSLPSGGNELRGKYFFDAVANDQIVNGAVAGKLRSKAQLKIPFLTSSLDDIGFLETNEFDSTRQSAGPLKKLIRVLDVASFSGGGVTDHGSLSSLNVPGHHPWALLVDGTRGLTGDWNAGAHLISASPAPTDPAHLTNKAYVDAAAGFDPAGSPVAGYVVKWNGSAPMWAPATAYAITAFAASVPVLEVGATATTPAFTAAHSPTPTTLLLTNTDNGESKDVHATPTSLASSQNYTKTTNNATVSFTITGSDGISSANRSASIAWRPRVFWGAAAHGVTTEAGIEALSGSGLQSSRAGTFAVNATGSLKIYWAAPASYGTPTFTVGGFSGGFTLVSATISVTNANSVTQNYQLWESDSPGLGSISVVVT